MMMPYKKIPKQFTIEMVNRVTVLINSLPKQNGIHSILSPREIVTGKKFRCPSIKIGQYVQGHTRGSNDTDVERSINALYIGRADNGSGHEVFKLNTKQPVSVNRVTIIPTTDAIINTVNHIGEQENQLEGMEFSGINGRITLQDFAANDNDEDSNASDDDFKMDEGYQKEIDDEIKLEREEGIVGNDDPDSQEDYFQNPIQQHNAAVEDNNAPTSVIITRSKRGINPIISLINATNPADKQECIKHNNKNKKKLEQEEENTLLEDDADRVDCSSTWSASIDSFVDKKVVFTVLIQFVKEY
jgi:hypothetical protein